MASLLPLLSLLDAPLAPRLPAGGESGTGSCEGQEEGQLRAEDVVGLLAAMVEGSPTNMQALRQHNGEHSLSSGSAGLCWVMQLRWLDVDGIGGTAVPPSLACLACYLGVLAASPTPPSSPPLPRLLPPAGVALIGRLLSACSWRHLTPGLVAAVGALLRASGPRAGPLAHDVARHLLADLDLWGRAPAESQLALAALLTRLSEVRRRQHGPGSAAPSLLCSRVGTTRPVWSAHDMRLAESSHAIRLAPAPPPASQEDPLATWRLLPAASILDLVRRQVARGPSRPGSRAADEHPAAPPGADGEGSLTATGSPPPGAALSAAEVAALRKAHLHLMQDVLCGAAARLPAEARREGGDRRPSESEAPELPFLEDTQVRRLFFLLYFHIHSLGLGCVASVQALLFALCFDIHSLGLGCVASVHALHQVHLPSPAFAGPWLRSAMHCSETAAA